MWCRIMRWFADRRADAGRAMPEFVRRHAARCDACRRFLAAADRLAGGLRASADRLPPAPPGLRARIIAQLDAASPGRQRSPRRARRVVLGLAGLAVAAALLVAVTWIVLLNRRADTPPTVIAQPAAPAGLPTVVEPSPLLAESSQAVEDLAGRLADRELTLLLADARSAGEQLLASVPLPAAFLESEDSQQDSATE